MAEKDKGGRPKGSLNKRSASALENIQAVFVRMDGTAGMAKWAKENPNQFYAIYSKLLPTKILQETTHTGEINHKITQTIVRASPD